MATKWAFVLSLVTFLTVGTLVFFFDKTVTYSSLWRAVYLSVPASAIAFICGYYLGKILSSSQINANLFDKNTPRTYVDDLLITPEELQGNLLGTTEKPPLDEVNIQE